MVEKALQSDILTINSIIDEVFPDIKTSLTLMEILNLAKDAFSYSLGENTGFPLEQEPKTLGKGMDCVVPADLATNVKALHAFLFENEEYTVSATVQRISDEIVYKTGVEAKPVDDSQE